jgi:hypothetical protein
MALQGHPELLRSRLIYERGFIEDAKLHQGSFRIGFSIFRFSLCSFDVREEGSR